MEITDAGKEKEVQKISVNGRIDAVTAPEFETKLVEWVEAGELRFVIDLSGLDYISSAGLRSFLVLAKRLKAANGKIFITAPQPVVKEVFEISGFSAIIPICDTLEAALAQM